MEAIEKDPAIVEITLQPIKESLNGELSKDFYYECAFCQKTVKPAGGFHSVCEILTGDYFHCPFCIRHDYHTKNNKHILILSFRAIIGYYYYNFYLASYETKMWLSEIKEMIESHIQTGLLNPLFTYDPETFMWFIDFSKVGKGKKKISVEEILKTISNILVCFNLCKTESNFKPHTFYQKYEDAIRKWYTSRTRPEGKRFLIPTFLNCGIFMPQNANFTVEDTKDFMLRDLLMRR
jgi:hypothetical protein